MLSQAMIRLCPRFCVISKNKPRGGSMKGRRKAKTCKWQAQSRIRQEAREVLRGRSDKQGKFLEIAARADKALEPSGRLAGDGFR